ncbi:hypothetical protein AB205_0199170, partial [Aquarana catesbeiana]
PSSTPKVIFSCQKNGSVIVFCVVEKDQNVTYKWTVNGTAFYRENSSNVTFSKEELKTVPMNVSCSVQNSVSMKESNNTQISCPEEVVLEALPCKDLRASDSSIPRICASSTSIIPPPVIRTSVGSFEMRKHSPTCTKMVTYLQQHCAEQGMIGQ